MVIKRYTPVDQWGQEMHKCMDPDENGSYVLAADYDALDMRFAESVVRASTFREERDALAARLAEAERDRDGGWKAFYALRKAVGEDRYPGLTGVVRTDPPIRPADSAEPRENAGE